MRTNHKSELLSHSMESNAESEWWLPESGLDVEKIDLKIEGKTAKSIKNQYYLARYLPVLFTLTSSIGIIIDVGKPTATTTRKPPLSTALWAEPFPRGRLAT